jgi:hypothetical protein
MGLQFRAVILMFADLLPKPIGKMDEASDRRVMSDEVQIIASYLSGETAETQRSYSFAPCALRSSTTLPWPFLEAIRKAVQPL